MIESITLPAPVSALPGAALSKWQREYDAFRRLLPELLATHLGKYVAIHDGKVIDTGDDKLTLALRVLSKVGNVDIHVGLVTEQQPPPSQSGVRREVRPSGGGA
jgi:hypothetical protein